MNGDETAAGRPEASLRARSTIIPAGGSVTLTCSVEDGSDGWSFDWFRNGGSVYLAAQPKTDNKVLTVSDGGKYTCRGRRGGRGGEVFYTDYSKEVVIKETLSPKPTVVLQPSWTLIYRGETVTATCQIEEGGGGAQWKYEWRPKRFNFPETSREIRVSDSGGFSCRGRRDEFSITEWSDVITVTVAEQPRPVLSVSPSWLSPGASVTLSCELQHQDAGWSFSWYKAVPDRSEESYRYELLPVNTTGAEQGSYILHGQTHTAGYVCRAGRGEPEYHSHNSRPQFVWSADLHPAASLTVSPNRVQHFRRDSVSLICGGNSTTWRVKRFTVTGYLLNCFSWGTMTGSRCEKQLSSSGDGVFWCESESGEFSNAVNISVQANYDDGLILESPIHPVTEGASVSLSCRKRGRASLSNVDFYHDAKLVQNGSRAELNISAVSQSDEGFYWCEASGKSSTQSWVSVKGGFSRAESSSFPVLMVVGAVVVGVFLLVLLLLFYRCKHSKGFSCIRSVRSQSPPQRSSTDHELVANAALYESTEPSDNLTGAAAPKDVIYSVIELKNMGETGRPHTAEEFAVYTDVKTGAADPGPLYSEISHKNPGKRKKKKGKSSPADEAAVYSEVRLR
ncbi:Fc receptor-like protein 4 [Menidia menidia]